MYIWAKMISALKESGDGEVLKLLDNEVRTATEDLNRARDGLADILASQKIAGDKCTQYKSSIEEFESYAKKALDQGDESLAMEVAEKIAELESLVVKESEIAISMKSKALELQKSIRITEMNIKRLKQQADTVKAAENVQRAQTAVANRGPKMRTAIDSLALIKQKQAEKDAQLKAATTILEETKENDLRERLQEAGIAPENPRALEVLDRLRKKADK